MFSNSALKGVVKIPKKQRLMVLSWINENLNGCANPRAVRGGKQLQGSVSGWRWRVGSYRVVGQIKDDALEIKVVRAAHRQSVYNNLPKI